MRLPALFRRQQPARTPITIEEYTARRDKLDAELASAGVNVDRYGIANFAPYNPDDLVGKKGLGVYDKMMDDDPQVKSAILFKKLAVLSPGWEITPAADDNGAVSEQDAEIAAFVQSVIENLPGTFEKVLLDTLEGLVKGFSVSELVWSLIEAGDFSGKIGLSRINAKPQKTFDFDTDPQGNLLPDGLVQFHSSIDQKRLDVTKFVLWTYQKRPGNYYGVSDLRPAYRYYFSKEIATRMWNVHLEKYAMPIAVGKVPPNTSADKRTKLLGILQALQQRTAMVINENEVVELLEATRAAGDSYDQAVRYFDMQIARAVLMPDLTSSEGNRVGSKALGQVHMDTFVWVLKQLGNETAEVVNEQIIQRLVRMNYDTTEYPRFRFNDYDTEDELAVASMFKELVEASIMAPTEQHIRERLNIPQPDPDETPKQPPPSTPPQSDDENDETPPSSFSTFALSRDPVALEGKVNFARIEKTLDRLEKVGREKLEEVTREQRRGLLHQVQELANPESLTVEGAADFQRVMNGLLTNGLLWGMYDAAREVNSKVRIDFAAEDLEGIAPEDAIAFFESKIPIPRDLLDQYSRMAFTISEIQSTQILESAKLIIQKGLVRGTPTKGLMKELGELFEGFLSTGEIKSGSVVTPYRLENIVRTNLIESYNTGRLNLYRSELVRDAVPAVMYSAIMDSRTTPFCRSWDGKVMKLDDPRVDEVTPPNHYQCRSILVPVTSVEEYTISETLPSERPSKGFGI